MPSAVTSQSVFSTALITLLHSKEYAAITVSDLCREAKLSRQTFYKFFAHKDALLEHLAQSLNLKYLASRDYRQRDGFFAFWLENREIAQVLIDRGLIRRVARVHPQTIDFLRPFLKWENMEQTPHAEQMLFEFISAGEIRLMEYWREQGWSYTPAEIADIVEMAICGDIRMSGIARQIRNE